MNIEIIRELARQWRQKAEPVPCQDAYDSPDSVADHISQSLLETKVDEAIQITRRECAQDVEDVIRIFTEFKYPEFKYPKTPRVTEQQDFRAVKQRKVR